jgi:hypothetical protein
VSGIRRQSIRMDEDLGLTSSCRCRQELGKLMGIEPKGQCVGSDPAQLDLGTVLENGDKGCVLWNMWATETK